MVHRYTEITAYLRLEGDFMKSILITLITVILIGGKVLTLGSYIPEKNSRRDEANNTQTEAEKEKDFPLQDGQTIYEWNGIRLQSLYPHNRPTGYDDPILSDTTAQYIIQEAHTMYRNLLHCGLLGANHSECSALCTWVGNDNNCIRGDLRGGSESIYYTYYAPEIDTMEKLENFIRLTFTEDSISIIEEDIKAAEYQGKATGISIDRYESGCIPALWGDFPTVFREDSEDGKEVKIQYNIEVYEIWRLSELYTFQYDEVYGWRIKLTSPEQMMNLGY